MTSLYGLGGGDRRHHPTAMHDATVCPCCGQPVTGVDVLVSLDANAATRGDRLVRLTPHQAVILHMLVRAGLRGVGRDALYSGLYGPLGGPPEGSNTLNTQITKLRSKLRALDLAIIRTGSRWFLVAHPPATAERPPA